MKLLGHVVILLNLLRSCKNFKSYLSVFQSCCTILYSHQQRMRVPVSAYPCQYLLFILFLTILVGVKWYLIIVLVHRSLMTNAVGYRSCAYWRTVHFDPLSFNWVIFLSYKHIYSRYKSLITCMI